MKIKQVEELVGITRKNIRFCEEQGLLNVERAENGYREYHRADIARLQGNQIIPEDGYFHRRDESSLKRGKACSSVWNSTWEN